MNILFVNYGDYTTNSLNHIAGFANALCAAGHACAVAVPSGAETISAIREPLFIPITYADALTTPGLFPDGRPADLIHAWTPREGVRKFVLSYQRTLTTPACVIVHLEDNERYLIEAYTGKTFAELRTASPHAIETWLVDGLPHPLRHETFLRVADGVTHIVDRLREFVPPGTPTQLLPPGVDFSLYAPQPADEALRAELNLRPDEKIIVFTGSNTFANEPEMRELYVAVALLNQRGTPTRLVRTGFNSPRFLAGLSPDVTRHVLDLGFIEKAKLPRLLALADVLVQPGHAGPFNDYRLPSKLPEFLAIGKPVILPATNLALLMQDGRDALFLKTGSPDEIADTCQCLFADPALTATLGQNATAFARAHFDLNVQTRALTGFYTKTLALPARTDWTLARDPFATETTLLTAHVLAAGLAPGVLPAPLASELSLLGHLISQLEVAVDESRSRAHAAQLAAEAESSRFHASEQLAIQHARNLEAREQLTAQHVQNLEARNTEQVRLATDHAKYLEEQIALARQHAANLETARDELATALAQTRTHSENLAHDLAISRQGHTDAIADIAEHKRLRIQAEALLRSSRQQAVAYENVLLQADAEVAALKTRLADEAVALAQAHEETVLTKNHFENLLAAERQATADAHAAAAVAATQAAERLAQAEAVTAARDAKIRRMSDSLSWRATAPFRALRRAFIDRPVAPIAALSDKIIGNIDYPQDWGLIPPTLHIRGWSIHREKLPLKAVRARLGKFTVSGDFGLERLDVLDHFRDFPAAERSGWVFKIEVPRWGKHRLSLEAQDETGTWHLIHTRDVKRTAEAPPPPPNSYGAWVAAYDTLTPEEATRIREKLKGLTRRPLISVLMPVYNVDERWLVAAIESVRRQIYTNWELCIADDASKKPHIRKVLQKYQRLDKRIKVVFRETNGHISESSNSALALAHGEFVALFDHDDELRAHALACVALELDRHPDADLIYSDEDKIDENGHRYDQYFKPDFNPDLFNVQNFVSHLGVYRTLLMREVGGFRAGYEGSQDWDLAMRVVERSAPDRIRHIPKILYHWRSVPGSTATLMSAKSYAVTAAERVITEHFARIGSRATITPTKGHYWRVHYPLPTPPPRVTLIIPTRNRLNVLRPCIESLLEKTTYPNFEILIVDNDSDEPETLAYLESLVAQSRARVVRFPGEFNYSAINNFGVTHTNAPVIGLLNNDLEVINGDWLEEMVSNAVRPEIGCVGAKLYYPDDRIQHAGVILGIGGVAAHAWQTHSRNAHGQAHRAILQQNLSAVTAACLVIRRKVYLQVGGLEADRLKVAFNDVDFCLKVMAAGYRNFWTPFAELYHHESASRGAEDTLEKRDRFRTEVEYMTTQWGDALVNDPAYNPNLTLTINDFTLATPPRPWAPLD